MPNLRVATFLIDLVAEPGLREAFDLDPKGTLDSRQPPLSEKAKTALMSRKRETIQKALGFNQQNQGPPMRVKPSGKKTSKKKSGAKKNR